MDKPRWLEDEPEIQQLLHWFVDRLDQQKQSDRKTLLSRPVNQKNFPLLFRHDQQADHEWAMLKALSDDYGLFDIKSSRKLNAHEATFANKSLVLKSHAEPLLRKWLNRPAQQTARQQWQTAVQQHADYFLDQGQALAEHPASLHGKSATELVAAFASLAPFIDKGLSLRQLSARCFWGHSKFLDKREALLHELFDHCHIRPRPVMVHVYLPQQIGAVLFIENQDSYLNAISPSPENRHHINLDDMALVYLAGFKGSAHRIRDPHGASLHFHNHSNAQQQACFTNWWFKTDQTDWPNHFWGDLDFAGMEILKSLRQSFHQVTAWQAGYNVLLQQINQQQGHIDSLAQKSKQTDPGQTGCPYADQILLPALRSTGLFIDQEWI